MLKATVMGDLNLDIILKLPHEPLPDTSVSAEEAYIGLGGVGGNTSLWLKYLDSGIDISLMAGVGNDVIGKELINGLKRAGVRFENIKVLDGVKSGIMAVIEYGNVKKIVGFRGANSLVLFKDKEIIEFLKYAKHAHTSGYFALNSDKGELLLKFLYLAKTAGIPASIDLEGLSSERPQFIKEVKGLVRYALLNRSELNALSKKLNASPKDILKLLESEALIVKLGDKGALIYSKEGKEFIKPKRVSDVVDLTGAGDAFNAAFILSLIKGSSLNDAVRNACLAGAEAVRVLGGSPFNIKLS